MTKLWKSIGIIGIIIVLNGLLIMQIRNLSSAPTGSGSHLSEFEIAATTPTPTWVYLPIIIGNSKTVPTATKTAVPSPTATTAAADFATQVVQLVNQQRIQAGCAPLTINSKLTSAAYQHSQDMALKDYFDHMGSDGSNPGERIIKAGYQYSNAAENIGAGSSDPIASVKAWMDSPTHKDNILNCTFTETGVGYYYLQNDTGQVNYNHYWTQVFATALTQ